MHLLSRNRRVSLLLIITWALTCIHVASAEQYAVRFSRALPGYGHIATFNERELAAALESPYVRDAIISIEDDALRYASLLPNDEFTARPFEYQWALYGDPESGIRCDAAWDITTGSSKVVVAVIDTGVDTTHPDFAGNIFRNPGEIAGNKIDDDGNGFIDDISGWDFSNNDNAPKDDFSSFNERGHGTHVAGTIGARGNNRAGVTGINWNSSILPLKVLNKQGSGSVSSIAKAIHYAVDLKERHGINVRVINMSFGALGASSAEEQAIRSATDAGILVVAAAGNESANNDALPSFPASYPNDRIISVAAITRQGALADFSNFGGATVDIAAPGVDILSTVPFASAPNLPYSFLQGTSMATPHVSGVAALMLSANSSLSIDAIRDGIYASGTSRANLAGSIRTGASLNAFGAVQMAASTPRGVTIQGRVVSELGAVAGALVSGSLGRTATDQDGYFAFEGVPTGTPFSLLVAKTGYAIAAPLREGVADIGQNFAFDAVAPRFQVRVTVRSSTGRVTRVKARLASGRSGAMVSSLSVKGSTVKLPGLPEGSYSLKLSSPGFTLKPSTIPFALRAKDLTVRVSARRTATR